MSKNMLIQSRAEIVNQEIQISLLSFTADFASGNSTILEWFVREDSKDRGACRSGVE